MSFSYGYHFCNNHVKNCIDARIKPERASLKNAIREMKDTVRVINKQISAAEQEEARLKTKKGGR